MMGSIGTQAEMARIPLADGGPPTRGINRLQGLPDGSWCLLSGLSLAPLSSGEGEVFGLVGLEGLKDGIGEAAFQYAHRLASAVATGSATLDQGLRWRMP